MNSSLHPSTPTYSLSKQHPLVSLVNLAWFLLSHYKASLRGTSLTAQVWVYSSQALTKPSSLPELLVGLVGHGVSAGAFDT